MRVMRWGVGFFCLFAAGLFFPWTAQAQSSRILTAERSRLAREVGSRLILLPNYSIFDNLEFEVSGNETVTIQGQVVRPSLKNEAERVIRALEGVGKLIDKIEVLPIALEDETMRMAVYHAIFSQSDLRRYCIRVVQPIHIIVNNGSVTLVGIVETQIDKERAGNAARNVPGTFGVTNKLRVEKEYILSGD
jgi:hyperosmotically inducible protein